MAAHEDYKCYGPYTRKDERQHAILIKHDATGSIVERLTISYPKYLVEVYLNRQLESNETVDHIDGNFPNKGREWLYFIKEPGTRNCISGGR